jgi:hypothetical protein
MEMGAAVTPAICNPNGDHMVTAAPVYAIRYINCPLEVLISNEVDLSGDNTLYTFPVCAAPATKARTNRPMPSHTFILLKLF